MPDSPPYIHLARAPSLVAPSSCGGAIVGLILLVVSTWGQPASAADPFLYSTPNSLMSSSGAGRLTDPYLPGSLVCLPVADPLVGELCAASGTLDFGDWTSALPVDLSPGLEFRGSGADEFDISFSRPVHSFGFEVEEISAVLELTFLAEGTQVSQRTTGLNANFWGHWSPLAFDEVRVRVVDPSDEVYFGAIYAGERAPGPIQKFEVNSTSRQNALDGEFAAVGAPGSCGLFFGEETVELFRLSNAGWARHTTVGDPDLNNGDEFGSAVALSSDLLLVGAPCFRSGHPNDNNGLAFLYQLDGAGRASLVKELPPPGASGTRHHGFAVALDGDIAAVGSLVGEVNLYGRDVGGPGNWGHVKTIVRPTPIGETFGWSVDLNGDRLAVGAPDVGVATGQGAAFLFERNAGGPDAWGEVATFEPLPTDHAPGFGSAVSLDANRLAVGAPDAYGIAYLFERDLVAPGEWGVLKLLVPVVGSAGFASSIALSGDLVVVGQPQYPLWGFDRDTGGTDAWGLRFYLRAPDGGSGGFALVLDGDWILSGLYMFPWRHVFSDGFEAGSSVAWGFEKP